MDHLPLPSKKIFTEGQRGQREARDVWVLTIAFLPEYPAFYPSSVFTTTTSSDFLLPPLYDVANSGTKLVVDYCNVETDSKKSL